MSKLTSRALDDGGPFALWAAGHDGEEAHCRHGVWVESELELDGGSEALLLRLRAAERVSNQVANVTTDGVRVALSLSTGTCSPLDERAAEFLAGQTWIASALGERLDWLRQRVARAAAQRAQRAPSRDALEQAEPGDMIPYDYLFPAAWDLVLQHEGQTYWAIDLHCPNPACNCADVVIAIHRTASPHAEHVGDVRIDLRRAQKAQASDPHTARIFDRVWERYREELVRRHTQVRQALPRHSAPPNSVIAKPAERVPRNAPCPCGSGKKFKRCCQSRGFAPDPG